MSRRTRLVSALAAAAAVTAGCGTATHRTGAAARPASPPSLATTLVTATGTWAVAEMGGSAANHNNFWQLFARPVGTTTWRLVTPPGVATNGGLVIATPGAGTVVAGFRPSQNLAYSPLATTHDNGAAWSPSLLDARLANVPAALAAAPGGGRLLALLTNGTAELSSPGGTHWAPLATIRSLARTEAGRRCGRSPPGHGPPDRRHGPRRRPCTSRSSTGHQADPGGPSHAGCPRLRARCPGAGGS